MLTKSSTTFRVDFERPVFMVGLGETWRKGRKILDGSLRPSAMMSYRREMQGKTHELLVQLRANPKDFDNRIKLYVGHMTINDQVAFREDLSCHSHSATT